MAVTPAAASAAPHPVANEQSWQPKPGHGRAPLNSLGIPFGLAGLSGTWTMAAETLGMPAVIGEGIWEMTAIIWVAVIVNYFARVRIGGGSLVNDLRHPVQAPFAALAPIVGMLLGTHFSADFPVVGHIVVSISMVAALAFGAWFVAQLGLRQRDFDSLHAGYLLPTVAAAYIVGQSAGIFGWMTLSVAAIGVGLLFWLLLGALILGRHAFRPPLPQALLPTFAIFSAPPAVMGNAWFASNGGRIDLMQEFLLGTFVLLILVQVALLAAYWRLPFTLGFWAFTFTAASSGTYALHWLELMPASGGEAWKTAGGVLVLAVVSLVVGSIAVRSVMFLVRAEVRRLRHPFP